MNVRRWSLAGLATVGLGLLLSASAWSNPGRKTLDDTALEQLWGGSPTLYCGAENVPGCYGQSLECVDYFGGASEGSDCISPTHVTRYYDPEACGSEVYTPVLCQNTKQVTVACTARLRCATIMENGHLFCDEISYVMNWVTITTDPNVCENLLLHPVNFPIPF